MLHTVRNTAELVQVFASANAGDRIELLPGDYDAGRLKNRDFDDTVSITSAEPSDPATFKGALTLTDVGNVSLSGLVFAPDSTSLDIIDLVIVRDSHHVTLHSNRFEGHIPQNGEGLPPAEDIDTRNEARSLVEGQAFARGIRVTESDYISLQNNEFSLLRKGIILDRVQEVDIVGNHLHDLRSDGVNLVDAVSVTIAGNLMESFRPLHNYDNLTFADHGDFIQWWAGSGGSGIRDLTIRDNMFLQGAGSWVQGIFGRGGHADANGVPSEFSGIRIENNLIHTSHTNGIFVGDARAVEILGNTLLPAPQDLTQPVVTSGIPTIHVRTSAKLVDTGTYDFSRKGALPQDVHIEQNVVVGANPFTSYQIDPARHGALNITAKDNTLLSAGQETPTFWGDSFPGLLDGHLTDVSDLDAHTSGTGFDTSILPARLTALLSDPGRGKESIQRGTPQDDVIHADGTGRIIDADAGADRILGTDAADVLRGGKGSDHVTTGAGRDRVTFHRMDLQDGDVDIVTDLDFEAGDSLVFSGGYGSGFFDDKIDPGNSLSTFRSGDSAIIHDRADLIELAAQQRVTAWAVAQNITDLRFDLDADRTTEWTLRLHGVSGIGETHARADATMTLVRASTADTLSGGIGDDIIFSHDGSDILSGGDGNDFLDGQSGADRMYCGRGDDWYFADNAGDLVIETKANGCDRIYAATDFTLADHIEAICAISEGDWCLTGNAGGNWMTGNDGQNALVGGAGTVRLIGLDGDNWLDGGPGVDILQGGMGSDRHIIDSTGDRVFEKQDADYDRVETLVDFTLGEHIDTLSARGRSDLDLIGDQSDNWITGNSGNNLLKDNGGNDRLIGLDGDNILSGGAHGDALQGGSGEDTFVISHGGGVDLIADFELGTDVLLLSVISDTTSLRSTKTPSGVLIHFDTPGDITLLRGFTQSSLESHSVFMSETPWMLDF